MVALERTPRFTVQKRFTCDLIISSERKLRWATIMDRIKRVMTPSPPLSPPPAPKKKSMINIRAQTKPRFFSHHSNGEGGAQIFHLNWPKLQQIQDEQQYLEILRTTFYCWKRKPINWPQDVWLSMFLQSLHESKHSAGVKIGWKYILSVFNVPEDDESFRSDRNFEKAN